MYQADFPKPRPEPIAMLLVLLVIHMMIAAALVGVVLLQKSEGGALGIGGGGAGNLMSGRGSANFLTRTTAILGAAFFATSLALTMLSQYGGPRGSVLDRAGGNGSPTQSAPATGGAPATQGPAAPATEQKPAETGGGVFDKLKQGNAPLER